MNPNWYDCNGRMRGEMQIGVGDVKKKVHVSLPYGMMTKTATFLKAFINMYVNM